MKIFFIILSVVICLTSNIFSQTWQSIPYPEFKPYTITNKCRADVQGNIWFDGSTFANGITKYSVARFDVSTEKWTEFSQAQGNLPKDTTIENSIIRKNGEFVVVTPTNLYFSNSSSSWNRLSLPEIGSNTSPILTIRVEDLMEDKDGNLWLLRNLRFNGTNLSHISRFNGTDWTSWSVDLPLFQYKGVNADKFNSYGNYKKIKQAPNGDIWLVGRNGFVANQDSADKYQLGGIARWNGADWKFWKKEFVASPSSLSDNGINFAIDNNNRLIIAQAELATNPFVSGGISIFDNGKFTFYSQDKGTIPSDTALGLPGQKFGNLVLNERFIANDVALNGNLWYFNSIYQGILEFDGVRWLSIANKVNGLIPSEAVNGGFSLAIDKNGDVWADIAYSSVVRLRKTKNSILDETSQLDLEIYPNPASDVLYLGNKSNIGIRKIELISFLGTTILELNEAEITQTTKLDTRNLATGRYLLKVTDSKGRTIVQQVGVVR